jgi:thymidylate synthase ThyX
MIQAKVIADSKNEYGNRITTMVVTMPRFILAEFNTHRMFSRNSASSRAIPFEKMVKSVMENPFIPIAWQKDHKGMQGTEYFTNAESIGLVSSWLFARDKAVKSAKSLAYDGVTKQLCNRLLEPFMWHTVIVTASEYFNFFALRCPNYEIDDEMLELLK